MKTLTVILELINYSCKQKPINDNHLGQVDESQYLMKQPKKHHVFIYGGAEVQVTGHRSGHRSDHRSHTKTIGHWTKLFLIDILLYKNKTSQGTSIIFFLFWTLPNLTHEKIYSCWSRKEDLRYSVTKVGNEITKVRKITWFVRKNESQNEGLLR